MQAPPLLKSKITLPRQRAGPAVIRPRLLSKLDEAANRSLTLLSAPAGFGKTTLLAQWLKDKKGVAWLGLDVEDNDPTRFFTYFLTVLKQVVPIHAEIDAALQSSGPLPVQSMLELLLSDLEAAPEAFIIVLDDYHMIQARQVHEAIAYLLEHQPVQMHWILATRADPPFPLGRLRAQGELFELRADDLRFTLEETAVFLAQITGLDLTPDQIHTLDSRTEGWIAGLQLAALSMQGRSDLDSFIQAFSGSHRFILDYLIEEVLNRQEESVQRFLLRTSILERFCGPLCDAILGDKDQGIRDRGNEPVPLSLIPYPPSHEILEYLDRSNLFLIPLDEGRMWYRYHHLFGELLRARLDQEEHDTIPELYLRASAWYDQNGFPAEAVQAALSASSYERAAQLIERYGQERWSISDVEFLKLINRLPPDMLKSRPRLGIYYAWVLILYGQMQVSRDFLKEMVKNIPVDTSDPDMQGLRSFTDLLLIYVSTLLGEPVAGKLPGREVLDFVPERHLGMRNSADTVYAMLLSWQGDIEAAAEILLNCAQRDIQAGGTTAVPITISYLARLRLLQGRPRQAEALCREYLKYVTSRGKWKFYTAGDLDIVLGQALLVLNDLEGAEEHIREGIQADELWQIPTTDALGSTTLARVQLAQGKVQEAVETMLSLEQRVQGQTLLREMVGVMRSVNIRLQMITGDLASVVEWADAYQPALCIDYLHEAENLSLARFRMAQGRYDQAIILLDQFAPEAETGKRFARLLEILLLKALSLAAASRLSLAYQSLESCLAIGEPEGILRAFLDEGESLRKLLSGYLHSPQPAHIDYAKNILASFGIDRSVETIPSMENLVEPLTPRELDVLRLICAGDSNQAIAEKLFITISAVKKHTGNIYGKLGVTSRTQAAVQARLLGLFP